MSAASTPNTVNSSDVIGRTAPFASIGEFRRAATFGAREVGALEIPAGDVFFREVGAREIRSHIRVLGAPVVPLGCEENPQVFGIGHVPVIVTGPPGKARYNRWR